MLLEALPFDYLHLESTFRDLDQIDFSRHSAVIAYLRQDLSELSPSSRDWASQSSARGILDDLAAEFQTVLPDDQLNTRRLALDLALSSIVVHSEDINMANHLRKSQKFDRLEGLATPDEDFTQATGRLSLGARAPRDIGFAFLQPQAEVLWEGSEASEPPSVVPENKRDDRVQNKTARSLMEEWDCGADPRSYEWKGWLESAQIDISLGDDTRPVGPMPSPTKFQNTFPVTVRTFTPLNTVASVPISPTAVPTFHSSPPARLPTDLLMDGMIGPHTQVERGPHGSRPNVASGKRKMNKKRIGGF